MNPSRNTILAAVFWLLLLGTLGALAANWVWQVNRGASEQLGAIEPRYARLLGMGSDKARLQEASNLVARDIERHAYPASLDVSKAGNDAQQRAREIFSRAGLEMGSIQVLPARTTKAYDRIPVTLRLEGELATLLAALAALPGAKPTLFVEGVTLQAATVNEAAPARVVAELQLFVLRARP